MSAGAAEVSAQGMRAQNGENLYSAFQLSFVPPLSTNGKDAALYTNNVSFNILAGISRNERAFTLAGLSNVIRNDAEGFQMAGVSNLTMGESRSFQLAGLSNVVGGNLEGSQFAGLCNTVRGKVEGFQVGGLANVVRGEVEGFQLGGLANIVHDNVDGFQLAGIANATHNVDGFQLAGLANATRNVDGFQLAGIANVTRNVDGFQLAGITNVARDVDGFQIGGLVNVARRVYGTQVAGFVNVADECDFPIGLVNIIGNGEMGMAVGYNEVGTQSLTFRSGGRVLYGIVGLGRNHKTPKSRAITIVAGYGGHIRVAPWLRLNNEITTENIGTFTKHGSNTFKASYSLLPAFRPSRHIEIFGGPSISYMESADETMFGLFRKNALRERRITRKDGRTELRQHFIGWQVGVQFIL